MNQSRALNRNKCKIMLHNPIADLVRIAGAAYTLGVLREIVAEMEEELRKTASQTGKSNASN